jgi:hypothetical protein
VYLLVFFYIRERDCSKSMVGAKARGFFGRGGKGARAVVRQTVYLHLAPGDDVSLKP